MEELRARSDKVAVLLASRFMGLLPMLIGEGSTVRLAGLDKRDAADLLKQELDGEACSDNDRQQLLDFCLCDDRATPQVLLFVAALFRFRRCEVKVRGRGLVQRGRGCGTRSQGHGDMSREDIPKGGVIRVSGEECVLLCTLAPQQQPYATTWVGARAVAWAKYAIVALQLMDAACLNLMRCSPLPRCSATGHGQSTCRAAGRLVGHIAAANARAGRRVVGRPAHVVERHAAPVPEQGRVGGAEVAVSLPRPIQP